MNRIELIKGDYLEKIKQIDKKVNLIMTDIPYNISKKNNFKTMKDRKGRNGIEFGDWDNVFNETQLIKLQDILVDGGSIFLFHSFEQFGLLKDIFTIDFKDKIIWQKTNPMPRNRDRRWISDIEIASWYVNGKGWTFNRQNDKYEKSVLQYPSESGGGFKRYHPTQKNLKMIEYLIKIHSNENDIILDPFSGSFTTAIACINTNRSFIGIEKDDNYFDIGVNRVKENINENFELIVK